MSLWDSLLGTMQALFHVGGPTGPALKRSTNDIQVRNAGDSALANLQAARATVDAHVATYLDVKERVFFTEFAFDGGTPPAAGANTGKYGFCHTSGGVFNAGAIYYDDGVTLAVVTVNKSAVMLTDGANAGTVPLIADGIYVATTGAAPYGWTLKGDGTPSYTGIQRAIRVPITTTGAVSTTSIPIGSKIMAVYSNVITPYSAGASIAVTVGAATVQATTENEPTVAGVYRNAPLSSIGAAAVVTATIAGAPAAGAGEVIVEYYELFFS